MQTPLALLLLHSLCHALEEKVTGSFVIFFITLYKRLPSCTVQEISCEVVSMNWWSEDRCESPNSAYRHIVITAGKITFFKYGRLFNLND
jgi:hypothetical protein